MIEKSLNLCHISQKLNEPRAIAKSYKIIRNWYSKKLLSKSKNKILILLENLAYCGFWGSRLLSLFWSLTNYCRKTTISFSNKSFYWNFWRYCGFLFSTLSIESSRNLIVMGLIWIIVSNFHSFNGKQQGACSKQRETLSHCSLLSAVSSADKVLQITAWLFFSLFEGSQDLTTKFDKLEIQKET